MLQWEWVTKFAESLKNPLHHAMFFLAPSTRSFKVSVNQSNPFPLHQKHTFIMYFLAVLCLLWLEKCSARGRLFGRVNAIRHSTTRQFFHKILFCATTTTTTEGWATSNSILFSYFCLCAICLLTRFSLEREREKLDLKKTTHKKTEK